MAKLIVKSLTKTVVRYYGLTFDCVAAWLSACNLSKYLLLFER